MFYNMTAMQSNAQSMTEMSSMNSAHHMMAEADGSVHDMSVMSTKDCCAQECDCLTAGCSTVLAFSTIIHYPPVLSIASKINSPHVVTASQTLTSLYKPPILS